MKTFLGACALAIAAACGCSDSSGGTATDGGNAPVDAALDVPVDVVTVPDVAPPVDVGDPHNGLRLPRCEDTEPAGTPDFVPAPSTLIGTLLPMADRVAMPDARPAMNPALEAGEMAYRALGFDRYRPGPGVERTRRMDLGGIDTAPASQRRSLAWFVSMADTQLADDESPTRYGILDTPTISGALRAQEAYLPRVMSAMNRHLAQITRGGRQFQFGVVAGDCADSGQQNEVQWFTQIMDGARAVHTDSGADDDPVPGPNNDPKDPFDAAAFPAPWYFVPGNHDLLVQGNNVFTDALRAIVVGASSGNGTRDYATWYAPPLRGEVVPDMNRRLVDRAEIVRMLRASPATPGPVGHGYPENADVSRGANWVADVVPNLLRVITLDTNDTTGGSKGMVRRAVFDGFLRAELERGQRDGVLVMLASHHPTTSIDRREGELGSELADAVTAAELEARVASYPNVIAWLVGHEHNLRVRAVRGADAAHPGYWEVQSGSLADWPAQVRAVELVDNGDGTLSLLGTMIDYNATSCMERRFRRLAMMEYLSGWERSHVGTAADGNVELIIPLPTVARARVEAATMTAPARIESETTLRGMR